MGTEKVLGSFQSFNFVSRNDIKIPYMDRFTASNVSWKNTCMDRTKLWRSVRFRDPVYSSHFIVLKEYQKIRKVGFE